MVSRRIINVLILIAGLLLSSSYARAQSPAGADSSRGWAVGMEIYGSSSHPSLGVMARRYLNRSDAVEGAVNFSGSAHKSETWNANSSPDHLLMKYSDQGWNAWSYLAIKMSWRHEWDKKDDSQFHTRIGIYSSFPPYKPDIGSRMQVGPEGALGWEWRPAPHVGLGFEAGLYVNYEYYKDLNYSTDSNGHKYLSVKDVSEYFYYGSFASIGVTFYLGESHN